MQTLYAVRDNALVLDNPAKRYVLTIHDLPAEDKPREKLMSAGPEALSLADLMAVLLTTGTRKEDVLSMANRIIKEYGEHSIKGAKKPEQLAADLDIPLIKAAQIVACVEIGRRLFSRNHSGADVVRTAEDVFEHAKDMRGLPKEHLRGIYLNAHYKVIHDEVISIGTVDTNIVHPREVFKPALEYSAAAVILAHNHPSGELEASPADVAVTRQLVEAGRMLGIPLIDHVIVTREGFRSVPGDYQ
ncbi:MAG TPA: DNA repair protein RadC [Candidatus Paceibacterota bacterium]